MRLLDPFTNAVRDRQRDLIQETSRSDQLLFSQLVRFLLQCKTRSLGENYLREPEIEFLIGAAGITDDGTANAGHGRRDH